LLLVPQKCLPAFVSSFLKIISIGLSVLFFSLCHTLTLVSHTVTCYRKFTWILLAWLPPPYLLLNRWWICWLFHSSISLLHGVADAPSHVKCYIGHRQYFCQLDLACLYSHFFKHSEREFLALWLLCDLGHWYLSFRVFIFDMTPSLRNFIFIKIMCLIRICLEF
jgi:hypothetical protein